MHTIGRGLFEEIEELRALLRESRMYVVAHRPMLPMGLLPRIDAVLCREAGAGAREKLQELSGTPTDPAQKSDDGR